MSTWIRSRQAGLVLVAAVVIGQACRILFEKLLDADVLTAGVPPPLGVTFLAVAVLWCGVIIWARLRVGHAVDVWARGWAGTAPADEGIPRRYVIEDRGARLAAGLGAILDLLLLLLMQNTVREPLLLTTRSSISPAVAEGAFATLLVLVALLILAAVYRTGKPVAAYLAWSALDRVVPTAGFVADGKAPAFARPGTTSHPALGSAATPHPSRAATAPVIASSAAVVASASDDQTVLTPAETRPGPPPVRTDNESTLLAPAEADPHVPAVHDDDPTLVAPSPPDLGTIVSERRSAPPKHAE